MYSQMPSYLTERFPTEVRATASAFTYHTGAIFGGAVAPILTYFAVEYQLGFAIPMLIGTSVGLVSVLVSLSLSPETKGHVFTSDIVVT
jgi:SHS family lactate transporter-like MFS transporter